MSVSNQKKAETRIPFDRVVKFKNVDYDSCIKHNNEKGADAVFQTQDALTTKMTSLRARGTNAGDADDVPSDDGDSLWSIDS